VTGPMVQIIFVLRGGDKGGKDLDMYDSVIVTESRILLSSCLSHNDRGPSNIGVRITSPAH